MNAVVMLAMFKMKTIQTSVMVSLMYSINVHEVKKCFTV